MKHHYYDIIFSTTMGVLLVRSAFRPKDNNSNIISKKENKVLTTMVNNSHLNSRTRMALILVVMIAVFNLLLILEMPVVASFVMPRTMKDVRWQPCAAEQQVDNISTEMLEAKELLESGQAFTVDDKIGSGSYGTVHLLEASQIQSKPTIFVGKRPWRYEDLLRRKDKQEDGDGLATEEKGSKQSKEMKERAERCLYYWKVEQHCFDKLPTHPQLPPFLGTTKITKVDTIDGDKGKENDKNEWMVFGFVGEIREETPLAAPTLQDLMRMDVKKSAPAKHELQHITDALGTTSYEETLDTILPSLLTVLDHVHKHKIVHRDVKPANLLIHDSNMLLMDFGSAADLELSGSGWNKQRVGLENGNRVAVSPVYAAPEIFIDIHEAPTSFDIFSSGLIFCQLMFGYLEERVDAGFRQQLVEDADCDLNVWLNNQLASKLRPVGLDQALDYLRERLGLWNLLADLLAKEPEKRPSARTAMARWQNIKSKREEENEADDDGIDHSFFGMVIEALETCEIPSISRPLHFVATFARSKSMGLILSEKDNEDNEEEDETIEFLSLWKEATKDASPGEVFVKGIVPDGQADELGIFEIGDRLSGIGELPFIYGGFERAVEMLQDQPRGTKNVRLHFDRLSVRSNEAISMKPTDQVEIQIADRGAWSSKGRRQAQEDTFVLHEIHDAKDRSILMAGVMDGHGGKTASRMVSEDLPDLFSEELVIKDRSRLVCNALEDSWNAICEVYKQQCMKEGECIAEYDPREGILQADTGSEDLTAGTTCSLMALDETSSELTLLNCGDSRSLVVSEKGKVNFATLDHTPQSEESRLAEGIRNGLDYSLPKCRLSRWSLKVGDYEYAVGRSLEGLFATSKGIVSDPDVSTLTVQAGEILISATDGLWNVMDSNEVANELFKMRTRNNMSAHDAARMLCSMAVRKGSSDNVSAVVVYL
jgi:serine/threonine protein phosphatase PrpC/serine/threonine protein kinase